MADVVSTLNNESKSPQTVGPETRTPSLYRGVVIEIIYDVAIIETAKLTQLSADVKNPSYLLRAPRNACIVKIVTGNSSSTGKKDYTVCFPFFPPHLSMPIKPGEHVWVFIEDLKDGPAAAFGYWICRVADFLHVDDVNYTHADRSFDMLTGKSAEREDKSIDEQFKAHKGLNFPNGAGVKDGFRLPSPAGYEEIYSGSFGMQSVTLEPVPRLTKRPGDLVLQGSNNTCIILGEDRGWNKETIEDSSEAEWSNATSTGATRAQKFYNDGKEPHKGSPPPDGVADPNERTFAGTIDIVVGRGRFYPDPEDAPELTACRVVTNSRNYDETDKNPVGAETVTDKDENRFVSPAEGDPDFVNDSSRIYVSMNTLPDFNFAIEYPKIPTAGSSNTGADVSILKEKVDGVGQAAVVIKSDEIRIIARQDTEKDPKIQGSITLIKEGIADDEGGQGRGIITIRPDGVIMIDGPKIIIGSGIKKGTPNPREKGGKGSQVSIGLGANEEPMVLGQQLVDLLTEFALQLQASMQGSVGNLGAPVQFPVYYSFVNGWIDKLENIKSQVGKLI